MIKLNNPSQDTARMEPIDIHDLGGYEYEILVVVILICYGFIVFGGEVENQPSRALWREGIRL
jgi:hypothetical protein